MVVEDERLHKDGIWCRDSKDRYVIFRGANFSSQSKLPPYLPLAQKNNPKMTLTDIRQEIDMLKPHLDLLRSLGFNLVRLLVMWKALEPVPNHKLERLLPDGEDYAILMNEVIRELNRRGLYVILDFHQDIAHEVFGGDGFPDWALAIDEFHPMPPKSNLMDKNWYMSYYFNPLVIHTLQSFWINHLRNIEWGLTGYPVRTHLERTIGHTVRFLQEINNGKIPPGILGIEPFNEPHPVGFDQLRFEGIMLRQFYLNVHSELAKIDKQLFIFIEPRVDWIILPPLSLDHLFSNLVSGISDFGNLDVLVSDFFNFLSVKTFLPQDQLFKTVFESNGFFSFHYYDSQTIFYSLLNISDNMSTKNKYWSKLFSEVIDAAKLRSLVPFLTEFGGDQDWEHLTTDLRDPIYDNKQIRAYMDLQYRQIESNVLSSAYWNYNLYNTKNLHDNWNLENFSLLDENRKPRNIDIACRPYPLFSSAKPKAIFFDIQSKYFALIISGQVVDSPTIIYVPFNMHYSPSFKTFSSSNAFNWDKHSQLLLWNPDKNIPNNSIAILPDEPFDKSNLPINLRNAFFDALFENTFR